MRGRTLKEYCRMRWWLILREHYLYDVYYNCKAEQHEKKSQLVFENVPFETCRAFQIGPKNAAPNKFDPVNLPAALERFKKHS